MKKVVCVILACLLLALPVLGGADAAVSYDIPGDRPAARLTDADVMTRMTIDRGASLTATLHTPCDGEKLYLVWYEQPVRTASCSPPKRSNIPLCIRPFR